MPIRLFTRPKKADAVKPSALRKPQAQLPNLVLTACKSMRNQINYSKRQQTPSLVTQQPLVMDRHRPLSSAMEASHSAFLDFSCPISMTKKSLISPFLTATNQFSDLIFSSTLMALLPLNQVENCDFMSEACCASNHELLHVFSLV